MQIYHTLMLGIIVTGLLFIGNASADSIKSQLEASPRHGEWVKVTTPDGRVVNSFVVYPEVKEPATDYYRYPRDFRTHRLDPARGRYTCR